MEKLETLNDVVSEKPVSEHEGVAVERGNFRHVMALTINPDNHQEGIVRCIVRRTGDVEIKGFSDRSELHLVSGSSLDSYKIGQRLVMGGEEDLIGEMVGKQWDFIGFEDPDIWIDPDDKKTHVYFTIPLKPKEEGAKTRVYLGHAQGDNLNSLEITEPVLADNDPNKRAKEVSIAPKNSHGIRLNLFESADRIVETRYSTVRVAVARQAGPKWEFGETVFHPAGQGFVWCAGHTSPGPLLPQSFIGLGQNKVLGILNGREVNVKVNETTKYGIFSPGLFIYDFEEGKIDWVSELPLFRDSQARIITFASHFVQVDKNAGILYAHVDDSFVRAYTLNAEAIKKLLP